MNAAKCQISLGQSIPLAEDCLLVALETSVAAAVAVPVKYRRSSLIIAVAT